MVFADDLKKSIRWFHGVTRADEPALRFDVTQQIDAARVNELRQGSERTLIETGFEEIHLRVSLDDKVWLNRASELTANAPTNIGTSRIPIFMPLRTIRPRPRSLCC